MYTEAECLDAIRAVADDVTGTFTKAAYDAARPETAPTGRTLHNRFGSWVAAVEAAGVDVDRVPDPPASYTRADCLDALAEVARDLDGSPTGHEYEAHRPADAPSVATIIDQCDGWNAAKQELGLAVHSAGRGEQFTRADCCDALTRVAADFGTAPTMTMYSEAAPAAAPSAWTIYNHFDDWDTALLAAGVIDEPGEHLTASEKPRADSTDRSPPAE